MSLSLAFSSALSGLHVTARSTQLVADNIANAQTDGYGVRTLDQSARVMLGAGSGVTLLGVRRETDQGLLTERRNAASHVAGQSLIADFWMQMERALGLPDEQGSLAHQFGRLEDALKFAASNPDSDAALHQIAHRTRDISQSFRHLQSRVLDQREVADTRIASEVGDLNSALDEIVKLNREIQRQNLVGGTPQALMDIRQRLVDQVAEILPVTVVQRENDQILLMARDGSVLADRQATRFEFERTTALAPSDLVEDGALSELMVNGRTFSAHSVMLSEGRLGAALTIRDRLGPDLQNRIDELAVNLVLRFMGTGADPSLPSGAFGLFMLEGHASMPVETTGIAGQLDLNVLADPDAGGALWRLRAGLHAPVPGAVSDSAQIVRMAAALADLAPLGTSAAGARSLHGHAVTLVSRAGAERLSAETGQGNAQARLSALEEAFAARGVDTDAELSKLMLLEKAYAANARVLATLDAMLRTVMEI